MQAHIQTHSMFQSDPGQLPQASAEVVWLNEATTYEILELKKQDEDLKCLINLRSEKLRRYAFVGEHFSHRGCLNEESDPELKMLRKEQKNINNR